MATQKPTDNEASSASASAPPAAKKPPIKVIKAEPGKDWPEPPHAGRWERDPVTGDLSLVEESTRELSDEERAEKRSKQRQEALAAQQKREAEASAKANQQAKE